LPFLRIIFPVEVWYGDDLNVPSPALPPASSRRPLLSGPEMASANLRKFAQSPESDLCRCARFMEWRQKRGLFPSVLGLHIRVALSGVASRFPASPNAVRRPEERSGLLSRSPAILEYKRGNKSGVALRSFSAPCLSSLPDYEALGRRLRFLCCQQICCAPQRPGRLLRRRNRQ
jgi:hypothetical protein